MSEHGIGHTNKIKEVGHEEGKGIIEFDITPVMYPVKEVKTPTPVPDPCSYYRDTFASFAPNAQAMQSCRLYMWKSQKTGHETSQG